MADIMSLDLETSSALDLKTAGAHRYAKHPSTRVTCLSWARDGEDPLVWKWGDPVGPEFPIWDLISHINRGGTIRAWNAPFEFLLWNGTIARQFPGACPLKIEQLQDTMIQSAVWGFPLSLQTASDIITPDTPKDASARRLMLQMARPRTFDPLTGDATWWHEDDPEKLDALAEYCRQDVLSERAIANRLPPIPPSVQKEWVLDQKINQRGVMIDTPTVQHMMGLAEEAKVRASKTISAITAGAVPSATATAKLLRWAQENGYKRTNLQKDTVLQALDEDNLPEDVQEVLTLRLDTAKTSTAKLKRMMSAADRDDRRVRGMTQFYGAFRTGRWAGRLVQLQNMPRPEFEDVASVVNALKDRLPYDVIESTIGPPARVVSTGLRACLTASASSQFVCADLGQIEARVVAWLAGQLDVLEVFESGQDVYAYAASKTTGKAIGDCGKGTKERDLGKVLTLACGFGMGAPKFQDTARKAGVILAAQEAEVAVHAWRAANAFIKQFWWDCDRAMRLVAAGRTDSAEVAGGRIKFVAMHDWYGRNVLALLPSGKRCLVYRDVRIRDDELTYMGMDQYTNKWKRLKTYGGKIVENLVQATARDVVMAGIENCEDEGVPIVLTVHDEVLSDVLAADAEDTREKMLECLTRRADWFADLPVTAEAWIGGYYRK